MCDKHFEPNRKSLGFKRMISMSIPTMNIPSNNYYDCSCLGDLNNNLYVLYKLL